MKLDLSHSISSYDGNAFQIINEDTLVSICGSTLRFTSITTGAQDFLAQKGPRVITSFACCAQTSTIAFATHDADHDINILSFPDKKLLGKCRLPSTITKRAEDPTMDVSHLAFSRCGSRLISIRNGAETKLNLWNVHTFQLVPGTEHLKTSAPCDFVSFDPTSSLGEHFAFVTGEPGKLVFWTVHDDTKTAYVTQVDAAAAEVIDNSEGPPQSHHHGPDSEEEHEGSFDDTNTHSHSGQHTFLAHVWTPEGNVVVSNSAKQLVVFQSSTGKLLDVVDQEEMIDGLVCIPEGLICACVSGTLLWTSCPGNTGHHHHPFSILQRVTPDDDDHDGLAPAGYSSIVPTPSYTQLILGTKHSRRWYCISTSLETDLGSGTSSLIAPLRQNVPGHTAAIVASCVVQLAVPVIVSADAGGQLVGWTPDDDKSGLPVQVLSLDHQAAVTSIVAWGSYVFCADTCGTLTMYHLRMNQDNVCTPDRVFHESIFHSAIDFMTLSPRSHHTSLLLASASAGELLVCQVQESESIITPRAWARLSSRDEAGSVIQSLTWMTDTTFLIGTTTGAFYTHTILRTLVDEEEETSSEISEMHLSPCRVTGSSSKHHVLMAIEPLPSQSDDAPPSHDVRCLGISATSKSIFQLTFRAEKDNNAKPTVTIDVCPNISGHARGLTCLSVARDNSGAFVTGSADGSLRLWRTLSRKSTTTTTASSSPSILFEGVQLSKCAHQGALTSLSWLFDSRSIFSTGLDRNGMLWTLTHDNGDDPRPAFAMNKVAQEHPQVFTLYHDVTNNNEKEQDKSTTHVLMDQLIKTTTSTRSPKFETPEDDMRKTTTTTNQVQQQKRDQLESIQRRILSFVSQNQTLPADERLEREAFVLHSDLTQRLERENASAAQALHSSLEREIARARVLTSRLRHEFFSSFESPGVSLVGIQRPELVVTNFAIPHHHRPETNTSTRSKAVYALRQRELAMKVKTSTERRRLEEETPSWITALKGLLHPRVETRLVEKSKSNVTDVLEALYLPTTCLSTKQRRNQLLFLQDLTRVLKQEFNRVFQDVWYVKESTYDDLEVKNARLVAIAEDLDETPMALAPCHWTPDEQPESRLFELYEPRSQSSPPENTQEQMMMIHDEERQPDEDTEEGKNMNKRALIDMMNGSLETKVTVCRECPVEKPSWMTQELVEEDMTSQQVEAKAEYERQVSDWQLERSTVVSALEKEQVQIQAEIAELTQAVDLAIENLVDFRRDVSYSLVSIEAYMATLRASLEVQTRLEHQALDIQSSLVKAKVQVQDTQRRGEELEAEVAQARARATQASEAGRQLDKNISRELEVAAYDSGLDLSLDELKGLVELYKHRTFTTVGGTTTSGVVQHLENIIEDHHTRNPYATSSSFPRVSSESSTLVKMDFDTPLDFDLVTRPECLDEREHPVWRTLQNLRLRRLTVQRQELEAQAQVESWMRKSQDQLAKAQDAQEAFEAQVETQVRLEQELAFSRRNVPLMIPVKQGQDETQTTGLVATGPDGLVIPTRLISLLNGEIQRRGQEQVTILERVKDFRSSINVKKWETQTSQVRLSNLEEHYTDLQLLRVTKSLQDFFKAGEVRSNVEKEKQELFAVELKLQHLHAHHERKLAKSRQVQLKLRRAVLAKQEENSRFKVQLEELEAHVAIREEIVSSRRSGHAHSSRSNDDDDDGPPKAKKKATPLKKNPLSKNDATEEKSEAASSRRRGAATKMKSIVLRRKLVDLTKSQTEEIEYLRQELDRLRRRTFPSFAHASPMLPDQFN